MLTWVLLGIFIILVVLPLLIGFMLSPNSRATRVELVRAPLDKVWDSLSDLARHTEWRSDLKSVQLKDDDQGLRWIEHSRVLGKTTVRKIKEVHHKEIVMSYQRGNSFKGTRQALMTAVPGGTRVTFTETREIRNPLKRLSHQFGSKLDKQLNQYISELKFRFTNPKPRVIVSAPASTPAPVAIAPDAAQTTAPAPVATPSSANN